MDTKECIKNLQQILISDKKIIFLLGAGCSYDAGIPNTKDILDQVEQSLKDSFKEAISSIKEEVKNTYNIEILISVLQSKRGALLNSSEKLNGLSGNDFQELEEIIKSNLYEIVNNNEQNSKQTSSDHIQFVKWISGISRKNCVEVFTTNYDCLIEKAFEELDVPFYDGFSGSLNPFFEINSVENLNFVPEWSKLWKIHGSVNWKYDRKSQKITRINTQSDSLLIYPSNLKYQESRKLPYIALIERLRELLTREAVLFTCGYSWKDEHINDTILNALNKNPKSPVFAFLHEDNLSDSIKTLSEKNSNISIYGKKQAIMNTKIREWNEDFKYTKFENFVKLLSNSLDELSENKDSNEKDRN